MFLHDEQGINDVYPTAGTAGCSFQYAATDLCLRNAVCSLGLVSCTGCRTLWVTSALKPEVIANISPLCRSKECFSVEVGINDLHRYVLDQIILLA